MSGPADAAPPDLLAELAASLNARLPGHPAPAPGRTLRDALRVAEKQSRTGAGWVYRRLLTELSRLRRNRDADAGLVTAALGYLAGTHDLEALERAAATRKAQLSAGDR